MEHRCGTRYAVNLKVYAHSLGGAVSSIGRLTEVSVTGGFVRTSLPLRPLTYVSLHVRLAELRQQHFVISGQVVRRSPSGLAIEWSDYAVALIRFLTERVENAPDSEPAVGGALVAWREGR
jgi:hypothetical protein